MSPDSSKYKLGRLEAFGRSAIYLLFTTSFHIIAAIFTVSPTVDSPLLFTVVSPVPI
jgi:hypothetical protein